MDVAQTPFDNIEPFGYGARAETPIILFGFQLAAPLLVAGVLLVAWLRLHGRAARAAAVEAGAAAPKLASGDAFVRGVVLPIDGAEDAVSVSVVQHGSEHKVKNGWITAWKEVGRPVVARPFFIELEGGVRLRIEPGDAPTLADDLSAWERVDTTTRVARARLVPGETVYASGELVEVNEAQAGYRGGKALVLRPPRACPMSLSTHGLAEPERQRARPLAYWAKWVLLATLVAQLLALPYHCHAGSA